ncbi:MAG: ABC1 kinase family protein [Pseudobdellovibrionaceae bacterium]
MSALSTSLAIGRTLKNAGRLRTIVSVFARHGFYNLAERIKLGQFLLERLASTTEINKLSVPERVRLCFEELGPTFVKLGQLLATRPDLVPEDFCNEFEKLQGNVHALDFSVIEVILQEEFGADYKNIFSSIDPKPLGSASIAQVHQAQLKSGQNVVIKVQRPGIIPVINDDLNVLYFLAELLEKYIPETRSLNPVAIIDEYFKTLQLETNFIVEANNLRRFRNNFKNDPAVVIPEVFIDLSTERVLVMELVQGVPLSDHLALSQPQVDPEKIMQIGLKSYLKMVFADGFFHGDLHPGNFFVLPENRIGLIDFGVVGRLSSKTRSAIANMLLALSIEDYERLACEYTDLAPFTDRVNVDIFAKDLQALIAPYYGLTLKNVNLGKILMSSSAIAAKHGLKVPTELMLFFKSIVAIEGIGKKIKGDFDFLMYSLEFAKELVQHQVDSHKILNELGIVWRESKNLMQGLPRQLNFLIRKMNSPDHAFQLKLQSLEDFKRSFEISFNLLFLAVIIASLILSATLIYVLQPEKVIAGMPVLSFIGYVLAVGLSVVAFFNYIKKG